MGSRRLTAWAMARFRYFVFGRYSSSCFYLKQRYVCISKHNIVDTGFSPRLQVKPIWAQSTELDPIFGPEIGDGYRIQSPKRCVLKLKQDVVLHKNKTLGNIQKHNICTILLIDAIYLPYVAWKHKETDFPILYLELVVKFLIASLLLNGQLITFSMNIFANKYFKCVMMIVSPTSLLSLWSIQTRNFIFLVTKTKLF
jgi:hypothetical protein